MRTIKRILTISIVTSICAGAYSSNAQESASAVTDKLPWLTYIGAEKLTEITCIAADASVVVSDGLTYSTRTVFQDHQRAVFHREYVDRTIAHGVEGRYIWQYDGETETEAPPMMGGIVLGHQMHAQILFFDKLHATDYNAVPVTFEGQQCLQLRGTNDDTSWTFFYTSDGQPLGMVIELPDGMRVNHVFDDWRVVSGISLPFKVMIDDGTRQFEYTFSSVRFNEDSLALFRAPVNVLTDEQQLLGLHRVVMDDHLFGETDGIIGQRGDAVVFVSAGEVYEMDGEAFDGSIRGLMSNRDYTKYDDLIRPIVRVSEDGTLAWVIVQVSAGGARLDESGAITGPLEFVSAWVSLFEKVQGDWKMVGNVSNLQPGRK